MTAMKTGSAQSAWLALFRSMGFWNTLAFATGFSFRVREAAIRILARCTPGTILILLSLGGCSVADVIHNDSKSSAIIPALRFVEYKDGRILYEDISNGNPEIADEIANIPVAQGAMKTDCSNLREIGVLIRHGYRSRGKFYGRHDYNYRVSWPDSSGEDPKYFTYEDQLIDWYLRGAARFLEPLSDGLLAFSVTHRREAIYTTEFEMIGCQ